MHELPTSQVTAKTLEELLDPRNGFGRTIDVDLTNSKLARGAKDDAFSLPCITFDPTFWGKFKN